jgi:hypothetical protein
MQLRVCLTPLAVQDNIGVEFVPAAKGAEPRAWNMP